MRALVVDDSRAMRKILSRVLSRLGVDDIAEAPDGQAALAVLESGPLPDIALVDWNMPIMNGLEFVTAVRKQSEWRRMAIMMVTTENEQSQIVRALAAGAHEYLIKPFDDVSLVDKLVILGLVDYDAVAAVATPGGSE